MLSTSTRLQPSTRQDFNHGGRHCASDTQDSICERHPPSVNPGENTVTSASSILIVDDDPTAIQVMCDALDGLGDLHAATSGAEALALLAEYPVDLVLLDVRMPDMDGFTTCRHLRQDHPDIPVIFVTAASDFANEIEALGVGGNDFISKPINPPVVRARVGVHLKLAERQADLDRAQSIGRIGSWRLDIASRRVTGSSTLLRLFGLPEGVPTSDKTFMSLLHPDDRREVARHWQSVLAGEPYDLEHRVLVNGKVKWMRMQSESEFDERGQLRAVFGTTQDITERREAAEQLSAQLRLIQAITDCAAESIFVTDEHGRVTFMNAEAERTFGWSAQELEGRVLHDAIHHHHPDGRPFPVADCPNFETSRPGERIRTTETVYFCKDGTPRTMACSSAPLVIDGQLRGLVLLVRDITELKRAEAILRETDRRKDDFLAMLAHELRNPLAPIRNAAHILGLLHTADPQVRWAQRIIEQQADQLTRLVDDLLDVSRIVRGKIILKQQVIDFAEIAQRAVEGTRSLIDAKGHQLQLDLPPTPLWVQGDVVRLSQVFVNLIDNAVKYTPATGVIRFSARPRGEEIEVLVEDNGMGIVADLLPHVFDLFQQEHRTLDRAQGGLGLGLSLVKSLVQAHGGRVVAESNGPGQGTRIRVWLPRCEVAPNAPTESPVPDRRAPSLRLLVVDDEAAVADSTALLLRLDGHQVQVARDGPTAIRIAATFQPQAVLLDIGLGGMDGYETARALRAGPHGAEPYLIAVTGYGDARAQELAREAGFDHYLVKPVEPEQLKQLLAELDMQSKGAPVPDR